MADLNDRTGNVNLWDDGFTTPVDVTTEQGKVRLNTASSVIQNRYVNSGNSSTSNLSNGASFTGTGVSLLSVSAFDVNFKADQNCTIQVQQSIDNTNWDVIDSFNTTASLGYSRRFSASSSYLRILVTNTDASPTTILRLQTLLSPIAVPLPRNLLTDISGQQRLAVDAKTVIVPDTSKIILELIYSATALVPVGLMRIKGTRYTVPTSYMLEILGTEIYADDNKSNFYIGKLKNLGTYNSTTNTYTANLSYTAPVFGSGMFLEVTTVMGNTNDQVYTVTYTNQDGVAGRTASGIDGLKLKKNATVGTILPLALQSGDYGVRSIQNVTVDAANTGVVALNGEINYINFANQTVNSSQQLQSNRSEWFAIAGEIIALDVGVSAAGAGQTAYRKINLAVSLANS